MKLAEILNIVYEVCNGTVSSAWLCKYAKAFDFLRTLSVHIPKSCEVDGMKTMLN